MPRELLAEILMAVVFLIGGSIVALIIREWIVEGLAEIKQHEKDSEKDDDST